MTSELPSELKLTISCNFAIRSADRQYVCTYGVHPQVGVLISVLVSIRACRYAGGTFSYTSIMVLVVSISSPSQLDTLLICSSISLAERHVPTSRSGIGQRARSVSCLVWSICRTGHWWTREQTRSSCKPQAVSLIIDSRISGVVICYEG